MVQPNTKGDGRQGFSQFREIIILAAVFLAFTSAFYLCINIYGEIDDMSVSSNVRNAVDSIDVKSAGNKYNAANAADNTITEIKAKKRTSGGAENEMPSPPAVIKDGITISKGKKKGSSEMSPAPARKDGTIVGQASIPSSIPQSAAFKAADSISLKIDNVIFEQVGREPEKRKHEKIELIVETKDINSLKKEIEGNIYYEKKLSGNFAVLEVDSEDIEEIAGKEDVIKLHANRDYDALLEDSIPIAKANLFWENDYTGRGIKIAILDTGINTGHPMLSDKVVLSKDFTGSSSAKDNNGHGTHVAGIAAGKKTESAGGYNGAAPDALLMNAKVLDDKGEGTSASIIEGINWAIDPDNNPESDDGADIISMSLGAQYSTQDEAINSALKNAIDMGVIVVIASGNCGPGFCGDFAGVTVPGNYKDAITVGAVNNKLEWAKFSSGQNFGDYIKPDIVAPGVDITSASLEGYVAKSGTSMATPMAAGMIAMMLEKEPLLKQQDIKRILEENAVDLGEKGKDVLYGSGAVDGGILLGALGSNKTVNGTEEPPAGNETIDWSDCSHSRLLKEKINNFNFNKFSRFESTHGLIECRAFYDDTLNSVIIAETAFNSSLLLKNYLWGNYGNFFFDSITLHGSNFVADLSSEIIWTHKNSLFIIYTFSGTNYMPVLEKYLEAYPSDLEKNKYDMLSTILNTKSFNKIQEHKAIIFDKLGTGSPDSDIPHKLKERIKKLEPQKIENFKKEKNSSGDFSSMVWDSCRDAKEIDWYNNFGVSYEPDGEEDDDWFEVDLDNEDGYVILLETEYPDDDFDLYVYTECGDLYDDSTNNGNKDDKVYVYGEKGDLFIKVNTYRWDDKKYYSLYIVPLPGNADYCDFWDKQDLPCEEDEYDCDSNGECENGLSCECTGTGCTGDWSPGYYDGCCPSGKVWNGQECTKTCSSGYTGKKRCSGSVLQKEYQNSDCNVEWRTDHNCNDDDYTGSWGSDYCSGSDDNIAHTRTYYDYSCSQSGSDAYCGYSPTYETKTVSSIGNDDYCAKAKSAGCTCGRGDYDCDSDSECSGSLICKGPWGGPLDGCCNNNEEWNENNYVCYAPCELDLIRWDRTSAVEGDKVTIEVRGPSSCSGKSISLEIYEDDGLEGAEINITESNASNFTAEGWTDDLVVTLSGTLNSNGDLDKQWTAVYVEDVSGNPEFTILGKYDSKEKQSSNSLTVTKKCPDNDGDSWTTCAGDCRDDDKNINPGKSEACDSKDNDCDGSIDEGVKNACGTCSACYKGSILSVSPTSFDAGKKSSITVQFKNEGDAGDISIEPTTVPSGWEIDDGATDGDNQITISMSTGQTKNFVFEITPLNKDHSGAAAFNAFWDGFGWDNHDLDTESKTLTSTVKCIDNDGDGYGSNNAASCTKSGADCNDNDKNIYPGAVEVCNGKDDNCNGKPDETFSFNTDKNNCGSCNIKCGSTEQCVNAKCTGPKCGDGICDSGENCGKDCIEIVEFSNPPSAVDAGKSITINVKLRNKGTLTMAAKAEVGIVPSSWAGKAFRVQTYSNAAKCCPANEYYDAKNITLGTGKTETVPFTLTAPNPNSADACNNLGSAWGSSFTLLAGVYDKCAKDGGTGYGDQKTKSITVNPPIACPNGKDGSKAECSCKSDSDCPSGNKCDKTKGYGACVIPKACNVPDGSSAECDCDSDDDCKKYGSYVCELDSGWDACIKYNEPDECSVIDRYECKLGNVYRCEQSGPRKKLILTDVCTVNEVCPNDVAGYKQCKSTLNYDLILEHASSGTIVNKQPGDALSINVRVNSDANLNVFYDSSAFNYAEGNCRNGNFKAGDNICGYEIKDSAKGLYSFKVNEDTETVRVIDDPYALYITNIKQLYKRYNDKRGVDVLLAKTYEKASQYKGVVYDLDEEIGEKHPFDYGFNNYVMPLVPASLRDNTYTLSASRLIDEKCNDCKETIIVGDDYVVPAYERSISEYESSFVFWGDTTEHNIYTDMPYIKRDKLLFSDFDEVFKEQGKYQGKNVLFVVPGSISSSMRSEIENLKQVLVNKGYKPDFDEIDGNSINCMDDRWFLEWEGKTLFIIGTEENNKALSCYPFVAGDNENSAFMERNLWDGDEHAVIINTNDEKVVQAFSNIIKTGEYAKLKSESAYFFKVGTEVVGYAALGVGVVALTLATGGAAAPITLGATAMIVDAVADGSDAVDSCIINNEGYGWCGASIGFAAIPFVPGRPIKNLLKKFADKDILDHIEPFRNLIEEQFTRLNKYFDEGAIVNAQRFPDDPIAIAKGSEIITKESSNNADTAIQNYKMLFGEGKKSQVHAVNNLKRTGGSTAAQLFADKGWVRLKLYKDQKLFRGVSVEGIPDPSKLADYPDVKKIFNEGAYPKKYNPKNDDVEKFVIGDYSYKDVVAKGAEKEEKGSIFVAMSKSREKCVDFARSKDYYTGEGTKYGLVMHTKPRSGDYVDAYPTLKKNGDASQVATKFAKDDLEVLKIEKIQKEDILGIELINPEGKSIGFVNNPGYIE